MKLVGKVSLSAPNGFGVTQLSSLSG